MTAAGENSGGIRARISEVSIDSICPYKNNPRNNEKSIRKVAASIREFGFLQPIVCDRDGMILAGHTRYAAARSLGLETVPVLFAEDLDPDRARAYRLADNKVGEDSLWDEEALIAELSLLSADDVDLRMSDFGFDTSDEYRRRKSWEVSAKRCGLAHRLQLRTKCGFLYASFFNTGKTGKTLDEIKSDPGAVQPFADNLADYLLNTLGGGLDANGWCICTTPRRRHREGFHFATEICRTAAAGLGIPFCENAVACESRGRIEPVFRLENEPKQPNVVLYDDVVTTGITMRDTRQLLLDAGHTVLAVAAIRNQ